MHYKHKSIDLKIQLIQRILYLVEPLCSNVGINFGGFAGLYN